MSTRIRFHPLTWECKDENGGFIVNIFGFRRDNSTILVKVEDYNPYLYIELPPELNWTGSNVVMLTNHIHKIIKPVKCQFQMKKRLYHAHKITVKKSDGSIEYRDKLFPFLRVECRRNGDRYRVRDAFVSPVNISGIGLRTYKVHELTKPELQLGTVCNIPMSGWISARGVLLTGDCESNCDVELSNVSHHSLKSSSSVDTVVKPLICSWDIECYSFIPPHHRRKGMKRPFPKAVRKYDVVYQIGLIFGRDDSDVRRYLLCLVPCDPIDGVNVQVFKSERDLIIGFTALIQKEGPDLLMGHNIFEFDIPYLIERAEINNCLNRMCQLGRFENKVCPIKPIKWSSEAYGTQEFNYIDMNGRLWVDTIKLIQRDYKLSQYTLNAIAAEFLKDEQKDDVTPEDIFEAYESGDATEVARVGHYCVQDCMIPLKVFNNLQYWIGLCEMSRVTCVPIWYLYTKGQQIKVFSQIYRECYTKNMVVQGNDIEDDEGYQGATVREPIPGLYKNVVPFDFASLYPTTIIAYNIDYSTIVFDESIPPEHTHNFEWEDEKPNSDGWIPEYRLRYLKQEYAKGIVPTMLVNLLDARKSTKKEMKKMKLIADELKVKRDSGESIDEQRYNWALSQYNVLDKRQLALKVSANSAYGAMGVKHGFLPFKWGAMCTTASGRQNIQKAADFLEENYGAKIVYGDSVTGDTPVLIRGRGYIEIQNLAHEYVTVLDKDVSFPVGLEVWSDTGYTKVNKIIRHKTSKSIFRIVTRTGVVDVTEDHSLLTPAGEKIRPVDVRVGDTILHADLPKELIVENYDTYNVNVATSVQQSSLMFGPTTVDSDTSKLYTTRPTMTHPDDADVIKKIIPLGVTTDYVYDLETENHHFAAGIGRIVVHNTDSVYLTFPKFEGDDFEGLWNYCVEVEKAMANLFPPPIKLEFEEKIYKDFLSFAKKRYAGFIVDSMGHVMKLDAKGVVLVRRDNCKMLCDIFNKALELSLKHESFDSVMWVIVKYIKKLMSYEIPLEKFIITKSTKAEDTYKSKTLPSHVKLAQKMNGRGMYVPPGTRIEYIFIDIRDFNANQGERVEDPEWYKAHVQDDDPRTRTRLDLLYYFEKQLVNPLDQLLEVAFGQKDVLKRMYKAHRAKRRCIWQIEEMKSPNAVKTMMKKYRKREKLKLKKRIKESIPADVSATLTRLVDEQESDKFCYEL